MKVDRTQFEAIVGHLLRAPALKRMEKSSEVEFHRALQNTRSGCADGVAECRAADIAVN